MKKNYFKILTMLLLLTIVTSSKAQTFNQVEGTASWPVGNEEQCVLSESIADAIQSATVTTGSDLKVEEATYFDTKMVKYTPGTSNAGNTESVMIEYRVKPKAGVTFKPLSVSYAAVKVGTDGATYSWSYTVGGQESAITKVNSAETLRNNGANAETAELYHTINIDAEASEVFSFRIYISNTANNKNLCFGDIKITGVVDGTVQDVNIYSVEVVADPQEGGTVSVNPPGNAFEEGLELTVSATRNFGFAFVNWTDDKGNVLSQEPRFKYVVTDNAVLTAHFEPVITYQLDVEVQQPANDYMVQLNPAPEVVDGKNMYEQGTKVTLTASNNKILTFTGWSTGETAGEIVVDMDGDKSVTASYAAVDFIAGWDFYLRGAEGRRADFAAEDNDADQFVLRDENGNSVSWLDKSQEAAGGYEGKPAAVNWRTGAQEGDVGHYYYQTKVDATAFTDIVVSAEMLYNYNAYQRQLVDYSLDGVNWVNLGAIFMEGAKNWTEGTFLLPAEANNQKELYFRWIPDKTSPIDGASSKNDGTAITNVFITGEKNPVDDGKAPVLIASMPENGAENASANGKIVLTFDEKVKVDPEAGFATLTIWTDEPNVMALTPVVTGKTVTYEYKGLDYGTSFTFMAPAYSIGDLSGNMIADPIFLSFQTKNKPAVSKAPYDFIVPDNGNFADAIAAANSRANKTERFRIFVRKGNYVIPASTTATREGIDGNQYPDATTILRAPNVSIIGEDRDATIVVNTVPDVKVNGTNVFDGIGRGDVLQLQRDATNTYFQDITLKSGMGDAQGRNIVLNDQSNKTICKNICLWAYQDTYISNNESSRFYFEGGLLRGRTDFLCGKGDVFYQGVTLQMCQSGGYITAPSKPTNHGYVFKDCVIKAEKSGINGNFTLGRPWGNGTPIALFIDTKMEAQPSAVGWNEMSNGWPKRFAEYNSVTATGTVIDLSNRKRVFGDNHPNDPILTAEEVAQLTLKNVMGGNDDWDPTSATEQASAPTNVVISGGTMTWDDNAYTLLWAIVKNGQVVDFTTSPVYITDDATATYAVRAANEMGGLGEATVAQNAEAVGKLTLSPANAAQTYTINGIRVSAPQRGIYIINGKKHLQK